MSAVPCSRCEGQMEEHLFTCPGCGTKRQDIDRPLDAPESPGMGEAPYKDYSGWLIIVVFIMVIVGVVFFVTRGDGGLTTDAPPPGTPVTETFQGRPNWREAGSIDSSHFVVMSQTVRDLEEFQAAGERICGKQRPCAVSFWTDPAMVPTQLPLSALQERALVATYRVDPMRGAGTWRWDCNRFSDAEATECL
jgi:hypothetical protein